MFVMNVGNVSYLIMRFWLILVRFELIRMKLLVMCVVKSLNSVMKLSVLM